jgi:hypothetical protein
MRRLLPLLAIAILFPMGLVGCGGPPEPAKLSDAELEEHRQEMIETSARERGG